MGSTRFRPLTPQALTSMQDPCQHCGFPTRGRESNRRPVVGTDWAAEVTDLWGLCGVAALRDGAPIGYLTFSPAELMPTLPLPGPAGQLGFEVGPDTFDPDAAVLTAVEVCSQYRGRGVGRDLVRSALGQLSRRQLLVVEVTGVLGGKPLSYVDSGSAAAVVMVPVGFWQAIGFKIVRPHPVLPVLRLELGSTARRRPDFAAAWRRFADLVSQPGPAQPGPARSTGYQHREPPDRQLTTVS